MAELEIETINHLLEVEKKAKELINKTQTEADKKIAGAKAEAEKQFRAAFEKVVSEKEKEFEEKKAQITHSVELESAEFKKRISSSRMDKAAFNSFLDKVLFD